MTTLRPNGIRSSATRARARRAYIGARLAIGMNANSVRDRPRTAPPTDRPTRFFLLRAMRSHASSSGMAESTSRHGLGPSAPRAPGSASRLDLDIERPFGMMATAEGGASDQARRRTQAQDPG